MVLELATVNIRAGSNREFEQQLEKAQAVISRAPGYLRHEFHACIEDANRYIFLIHWETLEDHTTGFRESELFREWRALIGGYFDSPPLVQHYELTFKS